MQNTPPSKGAATSPSSFCIFSALYAPSMGGVELYTANLATALVKLGHRVTVVTMNTHQQKPRERVNDIEIVRLPCRNALGGRYPLPRRDAEHGKTLQELHAHGFNHVIVNTRFYPLSCEGLRFARSLEITPILIEHGSAHLTMGNRLVSAGVEAVEHFMTWRAKRYAPRCYAVSKKASAWLGHFGIESCGELPNAIDADAFVRQASRRDYRQELSIPEDALLVASAGRLVPEKGVLQLAEAIANLEAQGIEVHAAFAGAGPLEQQILQQKSRCIHPLGKLGRHDLAALLSQADAYCLPSRSEGFATTLLEAASCGTPAIVTDVGGTDELIPNSLYGTILQDMSSETIASALKTAAAERAPLAEQGSRVAQRVRETCSWKQTALATLQACEEAQHR